MVNFSGFRNRFFKKPNVVAPKPNTANVGPNSNLEKNVRAYVNGYLQNRNTPNKVPVLNKSMVNALHKYINSKRARTAGAVAGVLGNANAPVPVQQAGAAAVVNVPSNATPAATGNQVGNKVANAGGSPIQAAASAAIAAKQQAVNQGKPANVANQAGATAAARMANANTQTPNAASNAARNGAAAAGLPENAQENAAKRAGTAAVLGNASAPVAVQEAGARAAGNSNATPAAAGNKVANAVMNAGGNATQAAAAAAAVAKQQAVNQGNPANVANGLAAAAAAKAANTNTQTPVAASNAARNGAAAAGLPENASRAAGLMAQASQPEPANQPVANNRKNMLKTLTNLTTNAIVNARIKEIRGKNPNAKWNNVNANGLTNGQKKVLNGLKMGKNYTGIVRQKTPNANNISQEN